MARPSGPPAPPCLGRRTRWPALHFLPAPPAGASTCRCCSRSKAGTGDPGCSILSSGGPLFSCIIGPLIIFLVKRDSPFVRFHALQAVLWQLVMMMFSMVFFAAVIADAVAAPKFGSGGSFAPVMFMLSFYALF